MLKNLLPLFFLLIFHSTSLAGYDVNDHCKQAWALLMDLKIPEAKQLLAREISTNPTNYYAYYLDQTCDVFSLLINSSDKDYQAFLDNYAKKRQIMDGKDENSPYYLSCYAEMELQVTVFNVMHGAQLSAMRKGYGAYRKVYQNLEKFPGFQPGRKLDGFFNVAIGNLPPFVKWAISFFGVSVDMNYGFRVLQENYEKLKHTEGLNAESAMYLILAAKINKTPEKVYTFTKSLEPAVANKAIIRYFTANIAYRTGKNEEALKTLKQLDIVHNPSAEVLFNYLMGKILLRKLDPGAETYLLSYIRHLKKKEYLKEMNYNVALIHLMNGDIPGYKSWCDVVKKTGMDLNERDREALYDASLDYIPDINLVKARLSLAGGYNDAFREAIKNYEAHHSPLLAYDLEYHFLKGVFDASHDNKSGAIQAFKWVIGNGEDTDYYFACEAALRLGKIYQEAGDKSLAGLYYQKSLKLYQSDFYEYIEDKARKAQKSL